jgi:hypothetical protein
MYPAHPTSSFLIGAQDSHLQTVTTPEAGYVPSVQQKSSGLKFSNPELEVT